jgi:hypothetical protein
MVAAAAAAAAAAGDGGGGGGAAAAVAHLSHMGVPCEPYCWLGLGLAWHDKANTDIVNHGLLIRHYNDCRTWLMPITKARLPRKTCAGCYR